MRLSSSLERTESPHEAKRATCLYPAWCLAIILAHNMLELQQMASGIGLDAWSAIAKFHELASA